MLTRRIARPLLAGWFVTEGVDAVRHPGPHVERMRDAWRRLAARTGLGDPPPTDTLRLAVRLHGGAMAGAGVLLAAGKAPRTSACALALLTLPLAVADAPVRTQGAVTPATLAAGGDRGARTLLRDLSLIGGALIAGLDKEGAPSLGWRVRHARLDRDAELVARRTVASARKEGKQLARETRAALAAAKGAVRD
ncbi:DoxX family membrane protein [Actinotalea fermentans]|uniref:DoxX family protein n=1 Tax=Actinotalea fermentans TaxID=43671 RepID=A0A511YT05_9CELL|nr:DoxX family membrane protein [Actinotalea fermentans]GEN78327.1 hypothetical protein AFE02nite_00610 [Actinotalea fermentans]